MFYIYQKFYRINRINSSFIRTLVRTCTIQTRVKELRVLMSTSSLKNVKCNKNIE